MNEQKYNLQDINAYLLGSLNEAEAERFDELSFTDDAFSDILKSAEKDLIDAYVQNELGGAELENFKSYYLASPLRREKVNFARAFQTFAERDLAKKAEESAVEVSKPNKSASGFFSAFNVFKALNPIFQLGFAAALLLIIFGGLWLFVNRFQTENQIAKRNTPALRNEELPKAIENKEAVNSNGEREIAQTSEVNNSSARSSADENPKKTADAEPPRTPKQENSLTSPKQENPQIVRKPVVATFLLTPSLRGNSQLQNLSIPAETSGVLIKLQLETNDYAAYRVVLINQTTGKNVWQSGNLKLKSKGENKLLNVNLPAKSLKSQVYSLQVSGVSADGSVEIISDYPFRIVR